MYVFPNISQHQRGKLDALKAQLNLSKTIRDFDAVEKHFRKLKRHDISEIIGDIKFKKIMLLERLISDSSELL